MTKNLIGNFSDYANTFTTGREKEVNVITSFIQNNIFTGQ
jgi:hypothetical protein